MRADLSALDVRLGSRVGLLVLELASVNSQVGGRLAEMF